MFTIYRVILLGAGEIYETAIHVNHNKKDMLKAKDLLNVMLDNHRVRENIICESSHSETDALNETKMHFIERPFDIMVMDLTNVLIDYLEQVEEEEERVERGKLARREHAKYLVERQLN